MRRLTVSRNQIDYAGTFEKPAFSLVNNPRILEGLYNSFAEFQVTLSDFRFDTSVAIPADNAISVFLKSLGQYRLKFDRVEWSVMGFMNEDIPSLSEVLKRGEEWLRLTEANLAFKAHTFVYSAHCFISESTAKDFFLSLSPKIDLGFGESIGDGLIFNWSDAKISGRFNLVIDHSLSIKDGVFIQLACIVESDYVNYGEIINSGQWALNQALAKLGLQFEQEEEIVL